MKPAAHPARPSGFTLIEVVIAIGIVALVMVPVVALLGAAIDSSRVAFANVNNSRIGAEVIGELQQADWLDINAWNDREIYYDYQGQRLPEGTRKDAVFTARVQIRATRSGVNLGSAARGGNPHLKQVLVAVSSRPGEAGARAIDEALTSSPEAVNGVLFVSAILVNTER